MLQAMGEDFTRGAAEAFGEGAKRAGSARRFCSVITVSTKTSASRNPFSKSVR